MSNENLNRASLALYAFIDNIEESHYEMDNDRIEYNLGLTIRDSTFSHVDIVIKRGDSLSVKAATRKDYPEKRYALVITTPQLPNPTEVGKFIESREVAIDAINELAKIYDSIKLHVDQPENDSLSEYELKKRYNDPIFFEDVYIRAVKEVKKYLNRLKTQISNLRERADSVGIPARKSIYLMAIKDLIDESLGDYKKFSTIFFDKLNSMYPDFMKYIDSDKKKVLEDRVKQFYKVTLDKMPVAHE